MNDVIAAIATAPGEGAVGIVRLSGKGCLRVASSFIRWRSEGPNPRAATLARAYSDGRLLDRVLVTFFPGPGSYTGEDVLEIGAHGSPYVLSRLLEAACRSGARPADPGEFTRRAFLNGRLDLAQAEAVCALIRARTRLSHRCALDQLDGTLSERIKDLRAGALDLLAHLEAGLDHPEDGVPELGAERCLERIDRLREGLSPLIRSYGVGRLAAEGARVALVGSPNVGKSCLLNALLGRDRAIVSETPGTTRDTLEEEAALEGLPAVLIDTAGVRGGDLDAVERVGIERTRRAMKRADVVVLVLDRSRPLNPEDRAVIREAEELAASGGTSIVLALNKSDLPPAMSALDAGGPWPALAVSALQGAGVDALAGSIAAAARGGAADPGENGVVVASLRHFEALRACMESLEEARGAVDEAELAASHVREALSRLDSIVGGGGTEELLDAVFSRFCVGK